MLIAAIFARFPSSYKGYYVDVGAYHPLKYSNTYSFYEKGWRGICVDPVPGRTHLFKKYRPRDIFLNHGVSESEKTLMYYMAEEPAYNTFSEEIYENNVGIFKQKKEVSTKPLRKILNQNLPKGCTIDFLSVDAEGFDLEVLQSNDWQRYRPRIVLLEEKSVHSLNDITSLEINAFMMQNNYLAVSRAPSALVYMDINSPACNGETHLNYR